jgi:hypothetical protein
MKGIRLIIVLLLTTISLSAGAQKKLFIKGVVIDEETSETLPIVNVAINGNAFRGAHTDPRGQFNIEIEKDDKYLVFTYVGFKTKKVEIKKSMINSKEDLEIVLSPDNLEIEEVVISAKWNPAYVIMKRVLKNSKRHNPDYIGKYKTKLYNKIKIKLDTDSSTVDESFFSGFYKAFDDYYMYVSETVSDRYYQPLKDVKNIIYANKVAGYELPQFNFNFDALQPFHFYDDFIQLYNKKYLNPASEGAEDGYYFSIKDTVNMPDGRASYKISFFPEKFVNFNALEGTLYIDTLDYAITKVYAEPKIKEIIDVKIEQEYQKVEDSTWFPSLLKFQLYWPKFPTEEANVLVYGETYPSELELNPSMDSVKFDEYIMEYQTDKVVADSNFWVASRIQQLNAEELRSYKHIDSLSKEYHVEEITNAVGKMLTEYYLPMGYLNIDVSKLYYFDNYQRHRFGFGLMTSDLLFKNFQIGGYATYGRGDNRWKHGVDISLLFDEISEYNFNFSYKNDMEEPTRDYLEFDRRFDVIRDLIVDRYNNIEEYNLSFGQRIKYFKYKVGLKRQVVTPHYRIEKNLGQVSQKFTEIELNFKYANKEKVLPLFGEEMVLPTDEPTFYFKYQQGIHGIFDSEYEYFRFSASLRKNFNLFRLGNLDTQIEAGYMDGNNITYHKLFSGRGSNHKNFTFFLSNYFLTMYQYEFTNNSYVNLFLRHRFEPLTFGSEYFKPTISISQNIGFGWMNDEIKSQNLYNKNNNPYIDKEESLKDMHKGYFETGISVSNIARLRIWNLGYAGLGIHAYYRWGPYAFDSFNDNVSVVFGFAYTL